MIPKFVEQDQDSFADRIFRVIGSADPSSLARARYSSSSCTARLRTPPDKFCVSGAAHSGSWRFSYKLLPRIIGIWVFGQEIDGAEAWQSEADFILAGCAARGKTFNQLTRHRGQAGR